MLVLSSTCHVQGWTQGLKTYIDSLKDASKWGGTPYSAR